VTWDGILPDMSKDDTEGKAPSALVVVDMINPYDFPDADAVARHAPEAVENIARLLDRARGDGVQVIYVNDNYGDWNSSHEELVASACEGAHPELVEPITPRPGDAFVIKARHSIFYSTPLEYLLATEGIGRVVLTGQVTEQCILYSALDAYVRNFRLAVVTDAVAHLDDELAQAALRMMERNMNADLEAAGEADLR
jgi:nicotinamidase-related amidase